MALTKQNLPLIVLVSLGMLLCVGALYNCECPTFSTNPDGTQSSHGIHDVHGQCNDPEKFLPPDQLGVCQPNECHVNTASWYRANNGGSEVLKDASPRFKQLNEAAEQKCRELMNAGKCQGWLGGGGWYCGKIVSSTPTCTCSNGQKVDTCTDNNKPCKNCDAGYMLSNGKCVPCSAGSFQSASAFTGSSCTPHKVCTNTYGSSADSGIAKQAGSTTTDAVCSVACPDVKAKHSQECGTNQCGMSSKTAVCKQLKEIYRANPACKCPSRPSA